MITDDVQRFMTPNREAILHILYSGDKITFYDIYKNYTKIWVKSDNYLYTYVLNVLNELENRRYIQKQKIEGQTKIYYSITSEGKQALIDVIQYRSRQIRKTNKDIAFIHARFLTNDKTRMIVKRELQETIAEIDTIETIDLEILRERIDQVLKERKKLDKHEENQQQQK